MIDNGISVRHGEDRILIRLSNRFPVPGQSKARKRNKKMVSTFLLCAMWPNDGGERNLSIEPGITISQTVTVTCARALSLAQVSWVGFAGGGAGKITGDLGDGADQFIVGIFLDLGGSFWSFLKLDLFNLCNFSIFSFFWQSNSWKP